MRFRFEIARLFGVVPLAAFMEWMSGRDLVCFANWMHEERGMGADFAAIYITVWPQNCP